MKVFLIQLLSITFVLLITGSIQSVTADHSEPDQGIFKNEREIEVVPIQDSNYQIYLQTVLRNGDGQMISVAEGMHGFVIPHQISDHVFDTLMGKKEIVTIDNIKYEKVQYTGTLDIEQLLPPPKKPSHFIGNWVISLCQVFDKHGYDCVAPWQANSSFVSLEEDDIVKNYWTILRIIN